MASFSTAKRKMNRYRTQASYISNEIRRKVVNENSHNLHGTFTTQTGLSKAQVKTHTHKKLTYFPGPYTTE